MPRPRRSTIVLFLLAAGLLVAAFLALRDAWVGSSGPPGVLWTSDPRPSFTPPPATAPEVRVCGAIDGSRVHGWRAFWNPRFGPAGTPDLIWNLIVVRDVSALDGFFDRLCRSDEEDGELEMHHYDEGPESAAPDGTAWRSWRLAR